MEMCSEMRYSQAVDVKTVDIKTVDVKTVDVKTGEPCAKTRMACVVADAQAVDYLKQIDRRKPLDLS